MNTIIQVSDRIRMENVKFLMFVSDGYHSYYHPIGPASMIDYDNTTRYSASYGMNTYEPSYITQAGGANVQTDDRSYTYSTENFGVHQ